MQIQFQDRAWEFNQKKLTISQAVVIKHHTGLNLVGWEKALADLDPVSVQALFWLVQAQNGVQSAISSLDFEVGTFIDAYLAARQADVDGQQPDPQVAGDDPTPG